MSGPDCIEDLNFREAIRSLTKEYARQFGDESAVRLLAVTMHEHAFHYGIDHGKEFDIGEYMHESREVAFYNVQADLACEGIDERR